MNLRKKVTTVFGAAAAASVIAGAAAFACTNLATLNLSSSAGKACDTVTVTGSTFHKNIKVVSAAFPVIPDRNGLCCGTLAQVLPDNVGHVSATFTVPCVPPGLS